MNRLRFPNGGVYLQGDDFVYSHNGIKDALKGICGIFFPSGYGKLWGCFETVVSGSYHVTEGYVYIDDEIYYVPAHTVVIPAVSAGHQWHYKPIISYPIAGIEALEDGGTGNTYEDRYAQLVYEVPAATYLPVAWINGILSLEQELETYFALKAQAVPVTVDNATYTAGIAENGTPSLSYHKSTTGTVSIKGSVHVLGVGSLPIITLGTILPVGFRPAVGFYYITHNRLGTIRPLEAFIAANGTISVSDCAVGDVLVFNLSFPAA